MDNDLLQQHPFINSNASFYQVLPPQMVSLKEKLPNKDGEPSKWARETLDVLGNIARLQYHRKRRYLVNYKLINGELITSDYFQQSMEDKQEFDMINELQKDLEFSFVKNYDIISQPFNTLLGELSELPDLFAVQGKGDKIESDKLKFKKESLQSFVKADIQTKILEELLNKGIDPNDPTAIQSEEQAAAFEQMKAEVEKQKTPVEIEEYFGKDFRHLMENWGGTELADQLVRFNIKKAQRIEYADYLTVAERYRHIFTDGFGLRVESLNPLNVFSHKSPETDYVQDGDYAGVIHWMSVSEIIDTYGHYMSKKQLDRFQKQWRSVYKQGDKLGHTADGSKINYMNPYGLPYQTSLPTLNRQFNEFAPWMDQIGNSPMTILDEVESSKVSGNAEFSTYGLVPVIHAYWKSQKKIGKLYWVNPQTQLEEKILIDETFYIPSYIKETQGSVMFNQEDEINTITWTWVNEVWRGIKVDRYFTNTTVTEPIYINIAPNDLQFKGELYIYGCKLPIAGQYANNRNTVPTSLVDKLKTFQWLHNILMNQVVSYLQTEVVPFAVMDAKIMHKDKDWGGENMVEKWFQVAKDLGVTLVDTSLENTKGEGGQGGQYPREVNLDRSTRIQTRFQLAEIVRQMAMKQVGMSDQRLGDVGRGETATGVNQAIGRSYTQTSPWTESFFDCEREILQMQIDAAQYLQWKKGDLGNLQINSIFNDAFLDSMKNDFNFYQLHVYVYKSQEEKRKLEYARKLAEMNTTNTPMSERIKMGTSDNIKDIVNMLHEVEAEQMEMQQQQNQIAQQQVDQQSQIAREQREFQAKEAQLDREYDLYKAYIQAYGYSSETAQDDDGNGVRDMLEFAKLRTQIDVVNTQLEATSLENQAKNENQTKIEMMKLADNREKRKHEQVLADKEFKAAKVRGDKSK